MAVRTNSNHWLNIFGTEATGTSALDRAATSSVKFVRSQDELGLWKSSAKGRVFTAKEALLRFGPQRLIEVWQEGSAILQSKPTEPAKTLRERREELGLTQTDLAHNVGLSIDAIAKAESPDYPSSFNDLTRIAIVLGLDEAILGFQPGAGGDKSLAVRLKAWRNEVGASPNTIAKLSRITWIIATQRRLLQLFTPNSNPRPGFVHSEDYGSAYYPVWDVARDLAQETRRLLGFADTEPIPSLRELCHRLQVPLIHAELPSNIAGATLATGDTRGVVINVRGNNSNVWVQRATVAHELGHLLWDPAERLKYLVVDNFDQIEKIDRSQNDWVEARANAFAVELLAPKTAIRESTRYLNTSDYEAIAQTIRDNMIRFGLSLTAMRYHLWNAYNREFDVEKVPSIDPSPTDEWKGTEQFTDDFFPLPNTSIERRGEFAGIVARAEKEKWLSEETAAFYLEADVDEYRDSAPKIMNLFDV
jgi:Zn-dependent peptidase ImmA (M78 family)/DNA-binding XRE family transcriptional regulator